MFLLDDSMFQVFPILSTLSPKKKLLRLIVIKNPTFAWIFLPSWFILIVMCITETFVSSNAYNEFLYCVILILALHKHFWQYIIISPPSALIIIIIFCRSGGEMELWMSGISRYIYEIFKLFSLMLRCWVCLK